jgi:hypothetical protein
VPERNWGSPVVIGVLPSKARVAPVQDLGVARACPAAARVDLGVTNPGVRCGTGATRLVFSRSEPSVLGWGCWGACLGDRGATKVPPGAKPGGTRVPSGRNRL